MKHILLFITDQQRWDTIAAFGDPRIQTPHLDALARDSVVFDQCITPSPVCVPARLSLLSGQYPARTGCNNNNAENCYAGEGFYAQITAAGYQSCCVGKMHHLIDPYGPMGFEQRQTQEELADPRDHYTRFIQENYPWVYDYHGMRSEMYYVPQISVLPPQSHPTAWVGDRSIAFIRNRDKDRPMFLVSSFVHPHPPFAPPAPWQKLYRKDPANPFCPPDMDECRELIGERCSCERLMMSEQDILRMKNYYHACVSFVDYQVGRIVQELKAQGIYDDTLIAFTSDHGDMMGDYGAVGKRTMVDASCHVPCLIHYPGHGHEVRSDVCSLVDFAPTLLRYVGVDYDHNEFDGADLFGEHRDPYVYSQHGCGADGTYMVTDGTNKLIYKAATDRYYFFNHIPEEKNVYDPTSETVQKMRVLLDDYRHSDANTAQHSKTYEPVTKTHPHYPGRMDHAARRSEEMAAIPGEYTIDLK